MILKIYRKLITDFSKFSLFLILLSIISALYFSKDFNLDASSDALLLEGDKDLEFLREVNDRYGSREFLVMTYEPNSSFEKRIRLLISNF